MDETRFLKNNSSKLKKENWTETELNWDKTIFYEPKCIFGLIAADFFMRNSSELWVSLGSGSKDWAWSHIFTK